MRSRIGNRKQAERDERTGPGDGIPDSRFLASPVDGFPFLHVGHRYYDPATGRFLQRDPIGIRGGLNVYEYAGSHPVQFIDPDGLTSVDFDDADVIEALRNINKMIENASGGEELEDLKARKAQLNRIFETPPANRGPFRNLFKKTVKKLPFIGIITNLIWPPESTAEVIWPIPESSLKYLPCVASNDRDRSTMTKRDWDNLRSIPGVCR